MCNVVIRQDGRKHFHSWALLFSGLRTHNFQSSWWEIPAHYLNSRWNAAAPLRKRELDLFFSLSSSSLLYGGGGSLALEAHGLYSLPPFTWFVKCQLRASYFLFAHHSHFPPSRRALLLFVARWVQLSLSPSALWRAFFFLSSSSFRVLSGW